MLADVDFDDEDNFYVMGHSDRTGRGRLGYFCYCTIVGLQERSLSTEE